MKPRIGVDKDDTILNYLNPFIIWYNDNYGIQLTEIVEPLVTLGVPVEAFDRFEKSEYFKYLLPIENAVVAVDKLSQKYDIIVVTASYSLDRKIILDNVIDYFPKVKDILFSKEKGNVAREQGFEFFVDDKLQFLEQINGKCEPIAYAQDWNVKFRGRRGNWIDILRMLN